MPGAAWTTGGLGQPDRASDVWAFLELEATRHPVTKSYVLRGPNKLFSRADKQAYISGSVEFGDNSFEGLKQDNSSTPHLKGLVLEVKITQARGDRSFTLFLSCERGKTTFSQHRLTLVANACRGIK